MLRTIIFQKQASALCILDHRKVLPSNRLVWAWNFVFANLILGLLAVYWNSKYKRSFAKGVRYIWVSDGNHQGCLSNERETAILNILLRSLSLVKSSQFLLMALNCRLCKRIIRLFYSVYRRFLKSLFEFLLPPHFYRQARALRIGLKVLFNWNAFALIMRHLKSK